MLDAQAPPPDSRVGTLERNVGRPTEGSSAPADAEARAASLTDVIVQHNAAAVQVATLGAALARPAACGNHVMQIPFRRSPQRQSVLKVIDFLESLPCSVDLDGNELNAKSPASPCRIERPTEKAEKVIDDFRVTYHYRRKGSGKPGIQLDFEVSFPGHPTAKDYPTIAEVAFNIKEDFWEVFEYEYNKLADCDACTRGTHRTHGPVCVSKPMRSVICGFLSRKFPDEITSEFTPAMKLAQLIQEKQRAAPQGRVLPPELAPGMASGELPAAQTPRKARKRAEALVAPYAAENEDLSKQDSSYEDASNGEPSTGKRKKKARVVEETAAPALGAFTPRPKPMVINWRSEKDELLRGLKHCFGYMEFKQDAKGAQWQRDVVEAVLDGKDVVVGRRTGDGKSLSYQLPPLIEALRGNYKMAVIISPLVSLMQDQVAKLNESILSLVSKKELGLHEDAPVAVRLGQGQPDSSVEGLVLAGDVRFAYISEVKLFANPTGQATPPLVAALMALARRGKLSLVAVDEAHVVEEWVDSDFRVDYEKVGQLRRDLIDMPFMALSAVPTSRSWVRIKDRIGIGLGHGRGVHETFSSIYRGDNLRLFAMTKYSFKDCFRAIRDAMHKELADRGAVEPTIVYMHSVKESEKVQKDLYKYLNEDDAYTSECDVKIRVGVYHGEVPFRERFTIMNGCDKDEDKASYERLKRAHSDRQVESREAAQTSFMTGAVQVIVATDAFGMGVDHACIRRIIFWGVPQTIEKFYNQLGRAGRDGNDANIFLMCNAQDFNAHEGRVRHDTGESSRKADSTRRALKSLDALRRYYYNAHECRWLPLRRYWGELPSIALVDDEQQQEDFGPCGKCDNCTRLKGVAPQDFSKGVLLALLLVDIAGRTPKWGKAGASAKIGDMLKLLTASGGLNEADKLRSQLKQSNSFWANKERVRQFVEYVPDVNEAEFMRKESSKIEVKTPEGKKHVVMTTFALTSRGSQVLAQYRSPFGGKFELMLPPPLFYLEHDEKCDDKGGGRGEGEECEECEPEGEGEELEEGSEEEEEFAEDQQFIEKKNGETVYVPLAVLDERIRTADGMRVTSTYLVAWKNYAKEECLAGRCKCARGWCKSWERAEDEYNEDVLWREHVVVAEWEALKTRPPEERSAEQNKVIQKVQAARAVAERVIAEAAQLAAQQAAAEHEARKRDARAAIDALPFAIRFALMATNGKVDIETIAMEPKGLALLKDLAGAESAKHVRDLLEISDYKGTPVRVPRKEKHSALVYHVTMGERNGGEWKIVTYDGPHRRNETKLFRELGAANLVELHIEDLKDEHDGELPHDLAVQTRCLKLESLCKAVAEQPIDICGRSFTYLLHKIEHQNDEAKLMLVAIGDSVIMAGSDSAPSSAAADADTSPSLTSLSLSSSPPFSPSPPDGHSRQQQHWSCAGGCLLSQPWETASMARALLADFATLPPAKMAKRLGLALSPSIPFFADYTFRVIDDGHCRVEDLSAPPEGTIHFVLWDEITVNDHVQEDGFGRISIDLVQGMPSINNGRIVSEADAFSGAPFALQGRVWANGNLAKGVWAADPFLPKRTVLIGRSKQLKVAARPSCEAASHGRSTFEVLRTYDKPNRARTGAYNLFCSLTPWVTGTAPRSRR